MMWSLLLPYYHRLVGFVTFIGPLLDVRLALSFLPSSSSGSIARPPLNERNERRVRRTRAAGKAGAVL